MSFGTASYLIRFDDLCPTMNWAIWDRVEELLIQRKVRPLVAVIPDNRDPGLNMSPAVVDFWTRVRGWESAGWTIGLHGHQHLYVTKERGLCGWDARSEFAGLPEEDQEEKIRAGLAIFEQAGVTPKLWIAPNHSFDETTIRVLRNHGVVRISDGPGLYPYRTSDGVLWFPMQLWRFLPRRLGVWTVCLHPNKWGLPQLERFERDLGKFARVLTDLASVEERFGNRRFGTLNSLFVAQRSLKIRGRRVADMILSD